MDHTQEYVGMYRAALADGMGHDDAAALVDWEIARRAARRQIRQDNEQREPTIDEVADEYEKI